MRGLMCARPKPWLCWERIWHSFHKKGILPWPCELLGDSWIRRSPLELVAYTRRLNYCSTNTLAWPRCWDCATVSLHRETNLVFRAELTMSIDIPISSWAPLCILWGPNPPLLFPLGLCMSLCLALFQSISVVLVTGSQKQQCIKQVQQVIPLPRLYITESLS